MTKCIRAVGPQILGIVVLAIASVALAGCGAYMKLDGKIARVRVVDTGAPKNVLVVEFDITNTAKIAYVVREAEIEVLSGSETVKGQTVAVRDIRTICEHVASLNHDCAAAITPREEIAPGETVRRLVAASFPMSVERLNARTGLLVRVRELDRMETELRESNESKKN